MLWIRRAGVLLVVVALTLAAGGSVAGAKKKHKKKTKHWSSSVTLTRTGGTQFAGTVGSKLGACIGSRVVSIYYTDPNTGETRPLSVQRTDSNGRYQVDLATLAYAGSYQAIVIERKIRAMKRPQICSQSSSTPAVV